MLSDPFYKQTVRGTYVILPTAVGRLFKFALFIRAYTEGCVISPHALAQRITSLGLRVVERTGRIYQLPLVGFALVMTVACRKDLKNLPTAVGRICSCCKPISEALH